MRLPFDVGYSRSPFRRWTLWPLALFSLTFWVLAGCGPEVAVATPIANTVPAAAVGSPLTSKPSTGKPSGGIPSTGIPRLRVPHTGLQATFTPETATPEPTVPPEPAAVEKQPPELTASSVYLELNSPPDKPLDWTDSITISGTTSPGATVSVNGIRVLTAPDGRFLAKLAPGSVADPVLPVFIEVIASHGAGSIAWTVTAALPPGDGVTTFIGEVTKISGDHLRAVAGETGIILLTGAGLVELTTTPATVVRIPAGPNLGQENRAAVSTAGGRVLHLMVLPDRPVTSVHFTGVVVPSPASSSGDAFLTLRDRQGNQVSAALPPDIAEPPIGTLATAILSRPSYGGELRITGLDTAAASLDRVSTALERAKAAGGAEALARLSRGLAATAKSRLILLDEASQWPEPSLAGGARAEFAVLRQAYEETLARYESSPVLLEVDGIITSLGPKTAQGREMTVGSKWRPLELYTLADRHLA